MDQPPPLSELPPPTAPRSGMSLLARLLNIFAIPGAVFDDVQTGPRSTGNWLVPVLLAAIVGIVSVQLMFSDAVVAQLRQSQIKSYNDLVQAGKMSRPDADNLISMVDRVAQPTILKAAGSVGALVFSFVRVFWWGFILWLIGITFLKTRFSYFKAIEIAGLATLVSVLGGVVGILLITSFGESGPGLGLTASQLEAKGKHPLSIVLANGFSIWLVALMASGLARLAGTRFARPFLMVLGYWIVAQMFLAFIGLAVLGLIT